MPKFYVCVNPFTLPEYDDYGCITTKCIEVEKGSAWMQSDENYRLFGGSDTVLLNEVDGTRFLEISERTLERMFKRVK